MMWPKIVAWYYLVDAIVIVLAVVFTIWGRRRRLKSRANRVPPGYRLTEETFVDPTTGIKQRVWYHPRTGDRFYETVRDDGE